MKSVALSQGDLRASVKLLVDHPEMPSRQPRFHLPNSTIRLKIYIEEINNNNNRKVKKIQRNARLAVNKETKS